MSVLFKRMKKGSCLTFVAIVWLLFSCKNNTDEPPKETNPAASLTEAKASIYEPCETFHVLNTRIRDGSISKQEAQERLRKLGPKMQAAYSKTGQQHIKSGWVFPVQDYAPHSSIGGENGSGYVPGGYDYFDGNKHTGHPAHDIFVYDSNQDDIDDKTGAPVNILSMTGGIVVSTENEWNIDSELRGGKYIWIYDPTYNLLVYYAHNSEVLVSPCDYISPGDTIARMGRTGLNAYKKRSPTHLHIMALQFDTVWYPRPVDVYRDLINAQQ